MAKIIDKYTIQADTAGELIDLREVAKFDASPFNDYIENHFIKEREKYLTKVKEELRQEFAQREKSLQNEFSAKEQVIKSEVEKQYLNKINELNTEISSFEDKKRIALNEVEKTHLEQIAKLKSEINSFEDKKQIAIMNKENELKQIADQEKRMLEDKIAELEYRRTHVKLKGEDFEKFTEDQLITIAAIDDTTYERTTKAISGTKPDYKVSFSDKGSVVIECKDTENFDNNWIPKLQKDVTNFDAKFGILIWNANGNNFPIKRHNNVFVIKPELLANTLALLKSIIFELPTDNDAEADEMLEQFNKWVKSTLEIKLQQVSEEARKTIDNANKIIAQQEKIQKAVEKDIFKGMPGK